MRSLFSHTATTPRRFFSRVSRTTTYQGKCALLLSLLLLAILGVSLVNKKQLMKNNILLKTSAVLQQETKLVLKADDDDDDDSSVIIWTVLWLVPMAWEAEYLYDILPESVVRTNSSHLHLESLSQLNANPDLFLGNNHTIVVTSQRLEQTNNRGMNHAVTKALVERHCTFVLFLLGEESRYTQSSCSRQPIATYIQRASLVLRNYWTTDCAKDEKVMTLPLLVTAQAYKSGYEHHCGRPTHFGNPPNDRKDVFFFSSSHKLPDRSHLVDNIHELTTGQNKSLEDRVKLYYYDKPDKVDYAAILANTRYAAVVTGNVEDTWRFMETLLCGAIPFMQRRVCDYYNLWLPDALMQVLPCYDNDGIQQLFQQIVLDISDEEYQQHWKQMTIQAQLWIDSIHTELRQRFQALS